MSPLSQTNNRRETVPAPRTGDRENTITKVRPHPPHAPGDRSSQVVVAVARTRRNESQCSNRTGRPTLEQLREVIEKRVDRACTRCGMKLAASGEHRGGAEEIQKMA